MTVATQADPVAAALADGLLDQWYADLPGNPRPDCPREVAEALDLIGEHGPDVVAEAYPVLIDLMRRRWPTALRWGATRVYWPLAVRAVKDRRKKDEAARTAAARRKGSDPVAAEEQTFEERWRAVWDRLSRPEQEDIERAVSADKPHASKVRVYFKALCLKELARRTSP